MLKKIPQNSC